MARFPGVRIAWVAVGFLILPHAPVPASYRFAREPALATASHTGSASSPGVTSSSRALLTGWGPALGFRASLPSAAPGRQVRSRPGAFPSTHLLLTPAGSGLLCVPPRLPHRRAILCRMSRCSVRGIHNRGRSLVYHRASRFRKNDTNRQALELTSYIANVRSLEDPFGPCRSRVRQYCGSS